MTFQQLLFPNYLDKAVTLSYDDGKIFDRKLISIMNKNNVKGTFNLNSGLLEDEKIQPDEFKKLYIENGHEVAVHGQKHLTLDAISDNLIIKDIINDRIALEQATGGIVTGMAYANGSFSDRVVDAVKKCGICYSRTTISTENFRIDDDWLRLKPTCHHNNEKLMTLVDSFLDDTKSPHYWYNHPKLFYLWGHSYEFERKNNWNVIEQFCEKIGNRQDVWYATNIQIYRYVEAFKQLVFSTDEKCVYNPTGIDLYFKGLDKKPKFVKAGQTILL